MFHLDHLPNQRQNEHVILFLRRHWITVLGIVCVACLLVIIPIGIGYFFQSTLKTWLSDPLIGPLMSIIAIIYLLSTWLFAFLAFTDYYLDTWIVTNERIINIEQEGLFHRTASELDLAAVQDATAEIRGMSQTLLGYGNVFIQTAGEQGRFHFKNISHPEHVKELVTQLVEEDKQRILYPGKIKTIIK